MLRDFLYAYRLLKKSPLSTAVIVLALALGIGANTSMFVSVNSILLRPFPYPRLNRIVTVWETMPRLRLERAGLTPANFSDFQARNRSFERLSAYQSWTVNILGADRPERVEAFRVTPGFFEIFGMKPAMGRTFTSDDVESGNDRVAVLSDGLWRARFGASPDPVGRVFSLGGRNYTIIGVMPDEFDYPLAAEVWVPMTFTPAEKNERVFHSLLAVGLLKPGVSVDQAKMDLQAVAKSLNHEYPKTNDGLSATVVSLPEASEGPTNQFIRVLSVAGLFLLLLAAANVANIQLARATNRSKTLAIETALGASRFRLARALCAETILVAAAGGGLALVAASWLNDLNRNSFPAMVYRIVPGLRHSRIDSTVVLFTVALSLLTGILCSLPAIGHLLGRRSTQVLSETLGRGSRSVAGDSRNRLRNILVIGEIALALLLLVGAGVMVNTFQHMLVLNLGFNPSNILTAQLSLPNQNYSQVTQINGFFDRLLPELAAISNVKSASVDADAGQAVDFKVKNRAESDSAELKPEVRVISERYFQTMELPMLGGRAITEQDRAGSNPVIVVSRSIAEHYWPGTDAIGQQIKFGLSPWLTVVGIAGDTKDWFTNTVQPAVYVPYQQYPVPVVYWRVMLRTVGDPALGANKLTSRVRAADASEPVYEIKTMEQEFSDERSGVEASARIMTGNAIIALFLAITGIYGVISYFVSQRTKEIGVRIALGAATPDILQMTLGHAFRVASIGFLIGIPLTYVLMRLLSGALYNVVVVKWTTFSAVTALLAVAALLASYLPARRAAAVDPVIALRNE
jgi:putative ABC transport system permease protein